MRKLVLAALAAVSLPFSAQAAVTAISSDYGYDAPAGAGTLIDFDAAMPAGFTLSTYGATVTSGTSGWGAAPATSATTFDTSKYLSVYGGVAELIGETGFAGVSLLWGSIDDYNTLEVLGAGGSSLGYLATWNTGLAGTGDRSSAATNRRVTITGSAPIYGLRFYSTGSAFEVDNIKFMAAVPEPASWAMMILGFGAMGAAARGTRRARVARSLA